MPHSSLPPEIWMLVASGLSTTNDLAHLCITSSHLFHILRPFLYHNVKLKAIGHQSNASNVLAVLAHDKSLAKCVIGLALERWPGPGQDILPGLEDPETLPRLIDKDALKNMVSLKRINIYGAVFRNADEQDEFGHIFGRASEIPLDELRYIADRDDEAFPADQIGDIGGLKELHWAGATEASIEPLWNILSESMTTLHTLSLSCGFCHDEHQVDLWDICFPYLRTFILDFWQSGFDPVESGFLGFIFAHSNTIEELQLGAYFDQDLDEAFYNFSNSSSMHLQPSSFPCLYSLTAGSLTVTSLAFARLDSLKTLRRLATGGTGMQNMFRAIVSPEIGNGPAIGHLFALQEIMLDLDVFKMSQWDEVVKIIEQCARCCPSLEVWRGRLENFKVEAELLGELFRSFKRLKVMYINEENVLGSKWQGTRTGDQPMSELGVEEAGVPEKMMDETLTDDGSLIEAYVQTIALTCGALHSIHVQRHPSDDLWKISRAFDSGTPAGEVLCSVSRCTIQDRKLKIWP